MAEHDMLIGLQSEFNMKRSALVFVFLVIASACFAADGSVVYRQPVGDTKWDGTNVGINTATARQTLSLVPGVDVQIYNANTSLLGQTIAPTELASSDFGSFTCNGTSCTVDNDAITLGTQTAGNYVSGVTANGMITMTGTEGATLGLTPCTGNENYIPKWNAATGWTCQADNSGAGGGYTNLTQFVDQGNWKVFYSDGSGDVKELTTGAAGTVLTGNGVTSAPSFTAPSAVSISTTQPTSLVGILRGNGATVYADTTIYLSAEVDGSITNEIETEDAAYGAGWNGDTTHSPSQNAVYDQLQLQDACSEITGCVVGAITANQTITLSGDASGSGTTAITVAVADDSHAHTTTTLSGIDIGDDTNLAGTANEITLTGDTLSLHSAITRDSEWNGIDFLVGTATAALSGEIAVGTTPGGELGGTWASPTIDDGISITNLTLVTPALGTPASGVVTNLTGTATAVTVGTAGVAGNLLITSPASSQLASGVIISGTAGENLIIDNAIYMSTGGKWFKAKADAGTTVPVQGISIGTANANASVNVLTVGFHRDDSWTWTAGGLLYLSPTTGGALTQTRPSTAGQQVQIVGYAVSATVIYFNPDYTYVEL
jgi:hypothetical protein